MNITDIDIASSAAYYPHTFDSKNDRVTLVRMSAADYRLSSFLDSRLLATGLTKTWFDYGPVALSAQLIAPKPLHSIFHTGHVGSTLLSRLLDEVPGVLGLREPHPLQTLADMADTMSGDESYVSRLKTFLRLWSRGFEATQVVILKATSITGRIAPDILALSPEMNAVYLNLSADAYITAILAARSGIADLNLFEKLRHKQLSATVRRELPSGGSPGELAAIAWMVEFGNQQRAKMAASQRVMLLDFETMLADLKGSLTQVLRHFGLPPVADQLIRSPTLTRYSKAPELMAFSPQARAELMGRTRQTFAREIERGLALIDACQTQNASPGFGPMACDR